MGKNWKSQKGRNERGGGNDDKTSSSNRDNRDNNSNKTWRVVNDLPSCKGLRMVLGTCDAAREREASKELVNLFNQVIEEINIEKPTSNTSVTTNTADDNNNHNQEKSIQSILQEELNEVRAQASSVTQNVMSINTNVKGIVCIKFLRSTDSPLEVVQRVFQKVKDQKQAYLRNAVRIIPFDRVFYPNEEELNENIEKLMNPTSPTLAPSASSSGIQSDPVIIESKTADDTSNIKEEPDATWTDTEVVAVAVAPTSSSVSLKRKLDDTQLNSESNDEDTQMNKVVVGSTTDTATATATVTTVPDSSSTAVITSSAINTSSSSSAQQTIQPLRISSKHPYSYVVQFKARNHNTIHKGHANTAVARVVPPNSKQCVTTKCQVYLSVVFSYYYYCCIYYFVHIYTCLYTCRQ